MKTEDIDKRIGMPDVDAEWARFEQEVIGKEPKTSKRSFYSWIGSFAIAASVVIVAGLFFLKHDSRETEQILTETSEHPISHEVGSEPSSSEKPTKLIAKTSQPKKTKENRKGSTVNDFIYVSTATDNTFDCGEESAVFPGGEEAMVAFFKENFKLPNLVIEYGAKGRIVMSFVIDSVGEVSDIRLRERPQARISYDTSRLSKEPEDTQVKIKELITLQLGEEGTRVLSLMPRWRPAIWGGKPRKTIYFFPISFDASKAERQEFLAKNQNIKPDSFKDLGKSLQHQPHKDTNPKGSIAKMVPRKELALANADAPASKGLMVSHHEYSDKVQEFNMDDVKDLAFESVDKALQEQIAGLDIVPNSSYFDSDTTMRLRGKTDNNKRRQPLIVLNGKILEIPDSARIENYDTEEQFASLLGVKPKDIKSIVVKKDSKETAKWGEKGAAGVIEISTKQHQFADSVKRNINEEAKQRYLKRFGMADKNDTLSDNYMNQHEELKASRRRISGIVLDENGRPLDCATIHIMQFQPEKKIWGVKTTDSKGKFAFWIPREGVKLHLETFFHKTVELEPTDKPLTIRMRLSKDGKKLKKLYFE